jgi:PAS domain S-box-containing protein
MMRRAARRRGIERKILSSILRVGTVPLVFALAIALFLTLQSQRQSVEETLLTTVRKTAVAFKLSFNTRLDALNLTAQHPGIVAALSAAPGQASAALDSVVEAKYGSDELVTLRLYDLQGEVLAMAGPSSPAIMRDEDWSDTLGETPSFLGFGPAMGTPSKWVAEIAAPVTNAEGDRLGFVSEIVDVTPLVDVVFGSDPVYDDGRPDYDRYQVVMVSDNIQLAIHRSPQIEDSGDFDALFQTEQLDSRLAEVLGRGQKDQRGTLTLAGYSVGDHTGRSFLAYDRLWNTDAIDFFVVASRPARVVYAPLYKWGAVGVVLCLLLIALLSLNAYRHVHNNIVRPVLLLNEGAQIIEQGDLELKLKINTGDEIEELAQSFNKMALTLNQNITELEDSEEKYRSLVTSMRDGILQIDPEGVIGFINPTGADILGYSTVHEALGKNLRKRFVEPQDLETFDREVNARGFMERTRVSMRRLDNRIVNIELSGNLLHDDDGDVIGIECIYRDVTTSVRLEREARERAERISAINQIANVINSSLEAGRLYDSLVVELKKLVEFDYAEVALLTPDSDAFNVLRLWPEYEQAARPTQLIDDDNFCARWVARNRTYRLVEDLAAAPPDFTHQFPETCRCCLSLPLYATGRIIGTLNIAAARPGAISDHDVDVLQQVAPHVAVAIRNAQLLENLQHSLEEVTLAREKLHNANEELKTLDELKTNLLSNVSHELRTPLVAVMGYTDMILNGKAGITTETQREYLEISLRNIEKLVTLIENLLDFSRLNRGAETLQFDQFDLTDCARGSMQIMTPVADARRVALILEAPDEPVLVEGDKAKMGQVFNNLLSNAVKFNRPDGSVTIEIQPGTEAVNVAVRDTGIGIPSEALEKVFSRFYQYDASSTRKYGGTGIGLAIAQDIARLHGSLITVSSEEGHGTTFRFTLPLKHKKEEVGGTPAEDEEFFAADTHLLIELITTDRSLSRQVRSLLESEGMDVIHASWPASALGLAHKHRPDCIMVDLDGDDTRADVLDSILADTQTGRLPIILLTNDEELHERYRDLVSAHIKRDFRKSLLVSAVQYALGTGRGPDASLGDKILCVDDEAEILTFLTRCLEPEGYTVDTCTSGETAIERIRTREYSLVLLDIAMPGMDGWEVCRRVKSDVSLVGVKIYMVSAKPVEMRSTRARESRPDGFLQKPFRGEDIVDLVHEIFAARPIANPQT